MTDELGHILVVDDHPDNLDLITRRLQRRGAIIDAVTSGQDALNHVASNAYDAILLDLMMPDMDGIETLSRLRVEHDATMLPVIMVTAKDDSESIVKCLHAGANDYVTKPIDFPVLLARVKSVVARKKAEDQLRTINSALEERVAQRTAELQSALDRFKLLLNSVSEGIFGIDTKGTISFANDRAAELLGRDRSELENSDYFELFCHLNADGSMAMRAECDIAKAMRLGQKSENTNHYFCRPGDQLFPVSYGVTPIRDQGDVTGAVISFQDVTQQRQMEMQVRQASKMEAVGRLTGSVAHDFNNLLTVIMGNLELMAPALVDQDKLSKRLEKIRKASNSAAELTKRLLAFSRQQILKTETVNINEVMADLEDLLERTLGQDVSLEVSLAHDLPPADTDRNQLENAVLNLCVNARDAMPEGGRICVNTSRVTLTQTECRRMGELTAGDYAVVKVADSGTGIPPEIIDKIFEPFFTTKGEGKGTGLGLSTVYGFMRQTGGHLAIDSAVGKGTEISLWLPLDPQSSAPHLGADPTEASVSALPSDHLETAILPAAKIDLDGGGRKVLVVDDDQEVREIAVSILTDHGFNVLEAGSGMAGLIRASENPDIAVVISDVRMPGGMNGPQMVERLQTDLPNLKAVFVSGYAKKKQQLSGGKSIGDNFLAKPYSADQLLDILAKTLAS